MIKANAYGHGLVPAARALGDADVFGVTDINEAETLSKAGLNKPVLILQGLIDKADILRVVHGNYQLVVHRPEDLVWLEETLDSISVKTPLTLWLKLDSGMGRLGLTAGEFAMLHAALKRKSWVGEIIALTHLANAGMPDNALNRQQLDCFSSLMQQEELAGPSQSIVASAGLFTLQNNSALARPGLLLYGSSPFSWHDESRRSHSLGLKAAMKLEARLISIREHSTGDSIGYNSWFICPEPMRIGIVSAGYADGYPAMTPNGCPVMIAGKRTTSVGRVSMDMMAIDLTDLPQAEIGMPVELWGNNISVDEVACHTGTISYELLSAVAERVPRIHV